MTAGDFVALALPSGTAILELAFGCWMLGATPAPLSHRLPPLELQALLDVLQPRVAIGDGSLTGAGRPLLREDGLRDGPERPRLEARARSELTLELDRAIANHLLALPVRAAPPRPA